LVEAASSIASNAAGWPHLFFQVISATLPSSNLAGGVQWSM
jgi:hypothetical protein